MLLADEMRDIVIELSVGYEHTNFGEGIFDYEFHYSLGEINYLVNQIKEKQFQSYKYFKFRVD